MASSVPARAGGSWIPDFRAKYEAWMPAALPLVRTHQYAEAYRWEAPPVAWRGRALVEGP